MHSGAFPSILRLMDYINNASPSILGTLFFFIQNQAHSAVCMMEANKTNWSSPPPPRWYHDIDSLSVLLVLCEGNPSQTTSTVT